MGRMERITGMLLDHIIRILILPILLIQAIS